MSKIKIKINNDLSKIVINFNDSKITKISYIDNRGKDVSFEQLKSPVLKELLINIS